VNKCDRNIEASVESVQFASRQLRCVHCCQVPSKTSIAIKCETNVETSVESVQFASRQLRCVHYYQASPTHDFLSNQTRQAFPSK